MKKLDFKSKKLDFKSQKLDFPAFYLTDFKCICAEKKSLKYVPCKQHPGRLCISPAVRQCHSS